jgi:hypothetical protein
MQHYLIKDGQYLISKTILPNSTVVTKRPSTKHHWSGNEWVFTGYTADESMTALRQERNQLLAQTDWRMASDYPGSNQTEWQTYRQALRDITTQTPSLDVDGNLTGITWPTPPTD